MEASTPERPRFSLAALWGVGGFLLILAQAIYRLALLAVEPISGGHLKSWQWGLYALSIGFNGYAEGYRAFQLKVAPRVVVRALHLGRNPRPLHVALAPFFVLGLLHATRRRLITSWSLYVGIVLLVIGVRQLDQPWRGIVDAGVVVGLSWGAISILVLYLRALAGHPPAVSAELPGDDAEKRG